MASCRRAPCAPNSCLTSHFSFPSPRSLSRSLSLANLSHAATHFKFIREIPIFARYEMRISILCWDEKWMYTLVRFVTVPKKGKRAATTERITHNGERDANTTNAEKKAKPELERRTSDALAPFPMLHTPASGVQSEDATPLVSRTPSFVGSNGLNGLAGFSSMEKDVNGSAAIANANGTANGSANGHAPAPVSHSSLAGTDFPSFAGVDLASLAPTPEPDGATLHCVSVSELCFKIGRVTVPPAVVLASEGFSRLKPSANDDGKDEERGEGTRYTHADPPPAFLASLALQYPSPSSTTTSSSSTSSTASSSSSSYPSGSGDDLKTFRHFLRAGWRSVPPADRWWEDALSGEVEERRAENLRRVRGVREGMGGAGVCLR